MSPDARKGRFLDMKMGQAVTEDGRSIPEHLRRLYLSGQQMEGTEKTEYFKDVGLLNF